MANHKADVAVFFKDIERLTNKRSVFVVAVAQDTVDEAEHFFSVIADTSIDARLLAFLLDGGYARAFSTTSDGQLHNATIINALAEEYTTVLMSYDVDYRVRFEEMIDTFVQEQIDARVAAWRASK